MSKRQKHQAPGRADRKGLSTIELFDMFPDEESARTWFEQVRWPDGKRPCPCCGHADTQVVKSSKPMPYRCPKCRQYFSVKVGTVMESSKLPLRKWVIALYLLSTSLKGISSMKLHRELNITQRTAWYLMQRIREGWQIGLDPAYTGPVEVDESYFGGKERNRHQAQKHGTGPAAGKTVVVGAKDRATNRILAEPVARTDKATLQGFVQDYAAPDAAVYTDEHRSYQGLANHEAVKHSVGEYVRGQVSTQGIDSFWSMVKRGYVGTFHHFSSKHLRRYIAEFAGRHNVRDQDTLHQMALLAAGLDGKRLRYRDLIAGPPAYP